MRRKLGKIPLVYGKGPRVAFSQEDKPRIVRGPDGATTTELPTAHHTEYHFQDERGPVVRCVGRQYVDPVQMRNAALGTGRRLLMVVLAPGALGGRLQAQSRMYEQNNVRQMVIHYTPVVTNLVPGQLLAYVRNDTEGVTTVVGSSEVQHGDAYPDSAIFRVSDTVSLDVDPENITLRYTDGDGEAALSTQGILEIITTVPLALGASVLGARTPAGSIWMDYDVEFFAQELGFDLTGVGSGSTVIAANAVVSIAGAVFGPLGSNAAPGAGQMNFEAAALSADGGDSGWICYGEIAPLNGAGVAPTFPTPLSSFYGGRAVVLEPGMGLWCRIEDLAGTNNLINRTCQLRCYESYDDAVLGGADRALNFSTAGAQTFDFIIEWRYYDASDGNA
jgi:hypothetical protein